MIPTTNGEATNSATPYEPKANVKIVSAPNATARPQRAPRTAAVDPGLAGAVVERDNASQAMANSWSHGTTANATCPLDAPVATARRRLSQPSAALHSRIVSPNNMPSTRPSQLIHPTLEISEPWSECLLNPGRNAAAY